jgi:membrane-bound lytic murein transglycosylase F
MTFGLLLLALAPSTAADLTEVQQSGRLRVLAVPFDGTAEFLVVNRFDLELLEGFARLHKLKLDVITIPTYAELIPALSAGKGDVIACGLTNTEARRKLVSFSSETFPSRMIVVTRKPHRVVASPEQLRGEKLGTEKGTSWAQATYAAGVPASSIDDSIRMQDLPDALAAGRITAAIFEVHVAIPAMRKDPQLQLGTFLGEPGSLAWAVRKGDAALLVAFNDYLDSVRRTPTWHQLVVKYFGAAAPQVLKRSRGN